MISIIIPVYNSEVDLAECLDSVLAQTYKDFEILLVNDGSTDKSAEICDSYATLDHRIRVFHQENSGVSAARNKCLLEAKGNRLLFVDSDDIIHEKMLASLVEIQDRTGADIVSCGFTSFADGTLPDKTDYGNDREITLSPREAVMDMFSNTGIGWNVWCKLYRRETFQNVCFPKEGFGEDKGTIYKVYLNAKKIVCTGRKYYYYRLRKNSLTGNRSKQSYVDTLHLNEDICDYFQAKDETLYEYACGYAAKSSFLYYSSVENNKDLKSIRDICVAQMRKYYRYIPRCKFLPLYQRMIVWLAGWSVRNKDSGFCIRACAALLRTVKTKR